jgi:prophage tail gpP-like protein
MPISPDSEELTIKVGGKTVGGWERFSVTRGVELLPSTLTVDLTEAWPEQAGNVTLAPFQECSVYLSRDLILTGYVDIYEPSYAATRHEVRIGCRSKTEDVIDCSVDVDALSASTGTWAITGGTIGSVARMLVKPYGVTVITPDDDPALDPQFPVSVDPGMTCYQLIELLARLTQMLVWDNEKGELVISRVGTKRAGNPLVEGINIEVGAARLAGDQRYSRIVAFGQYRWPEGPHISLKYEAKDTSVPRNRLLMVPTDMPGPDAKWLKQKAEWEIKRRYGRSRAVRCTVTGWRDVNDKLWTPNTLVKITSPALKITNEDMLISQVTWMRDEQGTRTMLFCMPPEGLMPGPFHFKPLVDLDPNARPNPTGQ